VSDPSRIESIFLAALAQGAPVERAAFLDAACKDDPDLRRRVERLLEAHPIVGSFLEPPAQPAGEGTAAYVPAGEQAGAVIDGRYKLVEEIGEGGMGTVWVAQQTEPVKRVVAVKLIKAGMDSKAVLARFEAERQALALMDHPNIARVLDGGATPDGRPFFVMELVKGVPITHFCDARKLTPRQRLELFVPVCQAIQHAHQKGIIHRDIKPSNVLIALYDDKPVPKVIDFGVAKATGQTLTDKSLMTGFGAVVGTPEYMSPEQASLNNVDIDTRSDVYSLGVLLYELLAGSPPFRSDELKKAGLMEMLRVVCEAEPPRPSVKLSTASKRASISAERGTEPKKLTGLLRNELDWIVMKALEKDRSRRYETVNGFAADVQRYLAGEAVQAHPPSAAYRLRKFARKYRVALTTVASFAVLLIAAAVVSSWLAVKANRAEAVAHEKRIEAEENAREAQKMTRLAGFNAGRLDQALEHAEWVAAGLQVDLDLTELRSDPRVGILRLAGTLKRLPENDLFDAHKELGESATVAVLAIGQDYAPLLPPITHNGQKVVARILSPDKQTLLTLGEDRTARLWNAWTVKPLAILRQGNEKVVNTGFSPDGKTVFTDDQTSVARFWDVPTGRFRAATEMRKNRYEVPDSWLVQGLYYSVLSYKSYRRNVSHMGANRLLTWRYVENKQRENASAGLDGLSECRGPVELWDTTTGRLVASWNSERPIDQVQFANGGEWVIMNDGPTTLLVYSAENGRLLAKLKHPEGESISWVGISPNGCKLATCTLQHVIDLAGNFTWDIREWDVETRQLRTVTKLIESGEDFFSLRYVTDDLFALAGLDFAMVYRVGQHEPIATFARKIGFLGKLFGDRVLPVALSSTTDGDLVQMPNGKIYDARTWVQHLAPPGRKFHPDLARFAPDGRFVTTEVSEFGEMVDTRTDKVLPITSAWHIVTRQGMISSDCERLIPPASMLNLPVALLELWAQVAVRGELGPDGQFVKWDEATWEKKRQQLASISTPRSDFPFPGYVATDKLHWLRAEFGEAKTEADKPRIARELLRRCESAGDRIEAVRWRAELDKRLLELAPPPRPVKR